MSNRLHTLEESETVMSADASMLSTTPSAPAPTTPPTLIGDVRKTATFLPIEVASSGDDLYWLISIKTEWYESGRNRTQNQLYLRCRHCNFGYNSHTLVTVHDLVRIGEEAGRHADTCLCTGRTLELLSPEIGR